MSRRNPGVLGKWGPDGTRVIASESYWRQPLKWNREAYEAGERRRVFCASLADVFEDRPGLHAPRRRLAQLIWETPHLDWLFLTKRPENANQMIYEMWFPDAAWPKNYWLGTSVEDQENADRRIPELLKVPAAVRFLSVEPMLGPIGLRPEWLGGLGWVIVGGESGHGARTFRLEWARSIVEQCRAAAVPCFVKQLGARPAAEMVRPGCSARSAGERLDLRDSHGGDWDEWPEDLKVREYPAGA
jgi:protein gp37